MNKLAVVLVFLVGLMCLTACGSFSEVGIVTNSPTSEKPSHSSSPTDGKILTPSPTSSNGSGVPLKRKEVNWSQLVSGSKETIDAATAAGNCKLLNELYSELKVDSDPQLKDYFTEAFSLANCG